MMKRLKKILATGMITAALCGLWTQTAQALEWITVEPENAKTGFVRENSGTRYYVLTEETDASGNTVYIQWYYYGFREIDGNWYYFNPDDGYMQTGIQELTINSRKGPVTAPFQFDRKGVLQLGLIEIDGVWRDYCIWSGTGYSPSEVQINYEGITGIYGDETILYYGDTPYRYIDEDGGMQPVKDGNYPVTEQRGWVRWDGNWYYIFTSDDNYSEAGWLAGGWCRITDDYGADRFVCFDTDTHIYQKMTGWQHFLDDDNLWTYFDEDGVCVADRWVTDETGTRYINLQGYLQTEQRWANVGGKWYYLDSSGCLQTDRWSKGQSRWYYAGKDGALLQNQWISYNGKWYFFGGDSAMMENQWVQWKGEWYYLGADGAMLINTRTPDGYWVDRNGVWVK